MVNRSGVWDLRQVGVNEVNQLWKTLYLNQRAVFMGGSGYAAGSSDAGTNVDYRNTIDFVTITTDGDASDFGDLTKHKHFNTSAASSTTRTVNMGGTIADNDGGTNAAATSTVIDYITLATTGNATDFGDLAVGMQSNGGVGNSTRAVSGGGLNASSSRTNEMQYITIATTGNATDFGDRTYGAEEVGGNIQNTTRGIFFGGNAGGSGGGRRDSIDFITIASTGNATDFGDLTVICAEGYGCSSPTRGVRSGGGNNQATNTLEFVTIASAGDGTDFGDLRTANRRHVSASNHTKGLIAGGNSHADNDEIQKITIASAGNATDFGDMTVGRFSAQSFGAASGAHGGLG